METVVAGAAGAGAVWGWLVAGTLKGAFRSFGKGVAVVAATAAFGIQVWWLCGRTGLLAFLVSVILWVLVYWAGRFVVQARIAPWDNR
jgi:hypothetical protein